MVLVVQLNEESSLEVLVDKEGLDLLKEMINKGWKEPIPKGNNLYDFDHEHLTSQDWGGQELTPEFTSENAVKIHSLKFVYLGKNGETLLS